jgi:CubicO group peptidase (beta-lactamase class C family)
MVAPGSQASPEIDQLFTAKRLVIPPHRRARHTQPRLVIPAHRRARHSQPGLPTLWIYRSSVPITPRAAFAHELEIPLNGSPHSDRIFDEAGLIRNAYAGKLLPRAQVDLFQNTHRMFAARVVRRAGPVQRFDRAPTQLCDLQIRSRGNSYDLFDYVSRNRVAGLLILKEGRIAFEHYDLGNDETTRWASMSMAKSITATLIGAAIRDGFIASVDDPVTQYLPQLSGTGYESVSIRNVLQMTSGVKWSDSQTDSESERRQMLELQIAQRSNAILQYMATRPRANRPGAIWNYNTGETYVLGALLRAATGSWMAEYFSERIWSKLGMEADASWWLEAPGGLEVAGTGVSATLRDYGRFGLFVLNDGVIGAERILPANWIREAGAPRTIDGQRVDYGYMWWPVAAKDGSCSDHAFSARGIFGQFMYINCRERIVIVVWSSRSKPKEAEAIADNDFFNAAVDALRDS